MSHPHSRVSIIMYFFLPDFKQLSKQRPHTRKMQKAAPMPKPARQPKVRRAGLSDFGTGPLVLIFPAFL